VNGGFTFVFGTLTLEGPAAGPATINVASHNSLSSSDFASSAPIALRANTTINTVSAQSSLTVAGPITGPITGPGVVLTKAGPGTLTLTGVSSVSSYAQTNVMAGTLNIRAGANVSDNIGTVGATINGPAGTVNVIGPSMWTNNQLTVGVFGTGILNITNGGQVTDSLGQIGPSGTDSQSDSEPEATHHRRHP
jgi:T5SS/PEP-CTERM-associated repeat protein/autotransporter-associated beta strand protein